MGITTPGNKTVFLSGNTAISSGIASAFNRSSSSSVIKGINSASLSKTFESDNSSNIFILVSIV